MFFVGTLIFGFIQKFFFGFLSESIAKSVRKELYWSILRKHMGYFDERENNAGALTAVLAAEVNALNGVSSEALGSVLEVNFAMLGGVVLAFVFSWRMALVALGTAPLMMFAGALNTQMAAGISGQEEGLYKEANMTVSDAVVNSKTDYSSQLP